MAGDRAMVWLGAGMEIDVGASKPVELALNDAERSRGLMYRDKLGAYDGMLFDFFQDAPVSFWMKNTLIPLDMLFIAGDGTIVPLAAMAQPARVCVWMMQPTSCRAR